MASLMLSHIPLHVRSPTTENEQPNLYHNSNTNIRNYTDSFHREQNLLHFKRNPISMKSVTVRG